MFEKVNPMHPDKIADRIAGAIVDLAYTKNENPKVAVEVLIGHGNCHIINETSETFTQEEIEKIVHRISRDSSIKVDYKEYKQDAILAENQNGKMRCGDNGIFKGVPINDEEKNLSYIAYIKAQKKRENIELSCAIGDEKIDGKPYKEIVKIAREYIEEIGGFEKLAEWGLIY